MKTIYNYYNLLGIKPKYIGFYLTIVLLVIFLSISLLVQVYSKKTFIMYDGTIDVYLDDSDIITKGDYLRIDNENYKYEIKSISKIKTNLNTKNYYQTYEVEIKKTFLENEFHTITIYYDKELIIKKLWKMLF